MMGLLKKTAVSIALLLVFSSTSMGITIKEEEKLAKEYIKIVKKYFNVIDDPLVNYYINRLGSKIARKLPKANFRYRFYVIKEPSYNAFAIAGGHIFIHTGLIGGLDNEEELAGILAHEICHVDLRHISESIDRSKKMTFAQLAAIAAALVVGSSGNGEASAALMFGSVAAMKSISTVYSRENEREADKKGLQTMVKAGYHPKGLLEALNLMRSKQWFSEIPSYFKTHPNIEERLAYISSFIEGEKKNLNKLKAVNNLSFERFKNKISGSYEDKEIAVQRYKKKLKRNPSDSYLNYGYALALERVGDMDKSVAHLKKALKNNPFDPHILKEIGKVYYRKGEYMKAKSPLTAALSVNSRDFEAKYYVGEIYKKTGNYSKAAIIFEEVLKKRRYYKRALYSIGETYGKIGNYPEAHYYLGLYNYRSGKYKTALFHFTKSGNIHNDPKRIDEIRGLIKKTRRLLKKKRKEEDKKNN